MQVLSLIIGWILGILTEPILMWIRRFKKRRDIKSTVESILKNLIMKFAILSFSIHTHQGTRDKDVVIWIRDIIEKYRMKTDASFLERAF